MTRVVFTDLDGTLLDHHSYSHAAAAPALAALREAGVPVVLSSSKTAAEIAPLHAALALAPAPFVAENGAGIVWSPQHSVADDAYAAIRAALAALDAPFEGFGDMTVARVQAVTGLSEAGAAAAKARHFSEPGVWHGDDAGLDVFVRALETHGITAKRGGRFLTLSFGSDKALAMRTVAEALGATEVIALGDAPNDAAMIAAADRGVIVANPDGPSIPTLPGERDGTVIRSTRPGPEGWNAAILSILSPAGAPR